MAIPKWVNLTDVTPLARDFNTTRGFGTPIDIDKQSGFAYYLDNEVVKPIFALGNIVIPQQFGAVANGVADDTSALNSFFAAVAAGSKGFIPNGTYKFTSALNAVVADNVSIEGAGENAVLLYTGASTTPDLLTFGDGTTLHFGLNLRNFTIGSSTTLTAGAALRIKKLQYVEIDIILNGPSGNQGKLYNGVYASASNYLNFHFSRIFALKDCALFSTCLEIHMDNAWLGSVTNSGTSGVHLAGGNAAFYSGQARQLGADFGILVDNSISATANTQVFINGGTFDGNNTSSLYVNDNGTTSISKAIFANAWFGSSGSSGIALANYANGRVYVDSGSIIINNGGAGINIVDTSIEVNISRGAVITNNTGYGVLASGAVTVYSDALPTSNGSGPFHTNITVKGTKYGPQAYSVVPATNWVHDFTANTLAVTNGGNAAIAAGSGLIVVSNPANGEQGVYVFGGAAVAFLGGGASWVAPTTTPAAGKCSVTFDGTAAYRLYNNYGSNQTFTVAMAIQTRASI